MGKIKRKFIILRKQESARTFDPSKGPMFEGATRGDDTTEALRGPIDFKVEVDELDERDKSMLQKEESILAPAMPIKLIEPRDLNGEVAAMDNGAWGLAAVGATSSNFSGHGVKVAVLDTGIDKNHEAFAGINMTIENFTDDADAHDSNGHGTHCAGTIFGKTVNGCQVGIAPNIEEAFIGKVLGSGGGDSESIMNAVHWAMESGANIISMSLGIDYPGYVSYLINNGIKAQPATSLALEGYRENINLYNSLAELVRQRATFLKPCLMFAASGNESERPDYEIAVAPPAASDHIISVGAIDKNLNVADFSNTKPNVCGPGVDILSAKTGGGLSSLSGTSMATPHVAGVAALWAEKLLSEGQFSIQTFQTSLLASVKKEDLINFNMEDYGGGLVQAP